jgi:4-hydroxybenzoate polyprenyltransferase
VYRLLVNLFQYIRWLSLDIALGGAILLLYISNQVYKLDIPSVIVLLLVVAILIIYTTDHLIDARRVENPTMPRHLFHKEKQRVLIYYLMGLAVIGCIGLLYVDLQVIIIGAGITVCSGLYLLVNRRLAKHGTKELVVALVYASAMFVYPVMNITVSLVDIVYWLQLFLIALTNLLIISYYEHDRDSRDKTTSIAHVIGIDATRKVAVFLLAVVSILAAINLIAGYDSSYHFFVLAASIVLCVVLVFDAFFGIEERYRFTCDAVFLIPVVFL